MKVLHIIPSVSPLRGGPSKAVIEMVMALKRAGVEAEIATTNDDGQNRLDVPFEKLVDYNGAPVRFFDRFSPTLSPIREFAYSSGFKRWLKQHIDDYDLIHVHAIFSYTSTYAMRLARKRNIPYIVRPIGQLETWAVNQSWLRKKAYLKLIEARNLQGASRVHFTADTERQQALDLLPTLKPMVCPLGVQMPPLLIEPRQVLNQQYNLAATGKVILYLSRLHPKKGLDLLFKALANTQSKTWQLLIAGDGDENYINELKSLIKELSLTEQCQFIGFVNGEAKQQLLQGADLYALTSYSENFGIAVLEALAAGTPTLVSKEVALAKFIQKQELGFVCELNTNSIKAALKRALESTEKEVSQQRELARTTIEKHFKWSSVAQKIITHYQNCLAHETN